MREWDRKLCEAEDECNVRARLIVGGEKQFVMYPYRMATKLIVSGREKGAFLIPPLQSSIKRKSNFEFCLLLSGYKV